MTFMELMNSPLLYGLVIVGLLAVSLYCVWMVRSGMKRCVELGIEKHELSNLIKGTITFSVVPSLSVVVGLFTLSTALGVPWSWFRLSVLGAVGYELTAADMAATGVGFESINAVAAANDPSVAGAIMLAMSVGIIGGTVWVLFLGEPIQTGMGSLNEKLGGLGAAILAMFTMALMAVMVPRRSVISGVVSSCVFIVAAGVTFLMRKMAKNPKMAWLRDFTMAFALILGMASTLIFKAIFK